MLGSALELRAEFYCVKTEEERRAPLLPFAGHGTIQPAAARAIHLVGGGHWGRRFSPVQCFSLFHQSAAVLTDGRESGP